MGGREAARFIWGGFRRCNRAAGRTAAHRNTGVIDRQAAVSPGAAGSAWIATP